MTPCLGGRERPFCELPGRRSAQLAGCPLVTVKYPRCPVDRARTGHGYAPSCCPGANRSAPGTFQSGRGTGTPPFPPIGLTAADLFAGGEGSRADSRVR